MRDEAGSASEAEDEQILAEKPPFRARARTALAALRGEPVVCRVKIVGGTVTLPWSNVHWSCVILRDNELLVPGPVIVRVSRDSAWKNNTGSALDYPGGVRYE